MPKQSSKRWFIAAATVAIIGFAALIAHNYKTKTSFKYNNDQTAVTAPQEHAQDAVSAAVNTSEAAPEIVRDSEILKVLPSDFVLGDKSAPVTMIEYASLSCPHCASFSRESFEKLKSEFIETGKVRFVFRNFPLNQSALVAAMFAFCQAQDNKADATNRYFATLKALYKTQDSWAFDEKFTDRLEAIAGLDGMSAERFRSCIADKTLQEKILIDRMAVAKGLQLKAAPAFFYNGEIAEGYVDYSTIKKSIEKKLAESAK